jgi:hypothetical protein
VKSFTLIKGCPARGVKSIKTIDFLKRPTNQIFAEAVFWGAAGKIFREYRHVAKTQRGVAGKPQKSAARTMLWT